MFVDHMGSPEWAGTLFHNQVAHLGVLIIDDELYSIMSVLTKCQCKNRWSLGNSY